jgi:hypothetical protein
MPSHEDVIDLPSMVGDIHLPFHGRLGSAKEESFGTTKLLDKPKSTILNLRSEGVVPVRTTFYSFVAGEGAWHQGMYEPNIAKKNRSVGFSDEGHGKKNTSRKINETNKH